MAVFVLAGVNDQDRQDTNRSMSDVIELLPLDRTGDRPTDRSAFEHLTVGHLVGANDPESSLRQPTGVGVAPEHLFGPLLESGVQSGGLPVPRAVRLEVDRVKDAPHGAGADGRDDTVEDGLPGQILARPVGDVQALGQGLQASQLDDLGPLEGGKSDRGGRIGRSGPGVRSGPPARSIGRSSRRWPRRTASGRRPCCCGRPGSWPGRCGPGGPDTTTATRCERPAGGRAGHPGQCTRVGACVHASGHLALMGCNESQHKRWPRIPCITYGQRH